MAQENPTMEKNKVDKVMEYIMNTPENTNPAILKSMLENLSSDDGSESDFSTAEVTFVNNTSLTADVTCICVYEGSLDNGFASVMSESTNRNVVLYLQNQYISMNFSQTYGGENITVEVSGDITVNEVDLPYINLIISGAGTITLNES